LHKQCGFRVCFHCQIQGLAWKVVDIEPNLLEGPGHQGNSFIRLEPSDKGTHMGDFISNTDQKESGYLDWNT
jgi:hypothetical protein